MSAASSASPNNAPTTTRGAILVVEGGKSGMGALLVDAIEGQQQVVIKSLESNYQRVPRHRRRDHSRRRSDRPHSRYATRIVSNSSGDPRPELIQSMAG